MNEDKNTEKHTLFKSFHLKEWILLSLLLFSNTISPMTFLCISPFFADVSLSKGLSLTLEGIIFAIFSFCGFLLSPFVGRMIPIFGVRYIYTLGLTLLSLGTLIFSTTNLINSGIWFFITTFILRVLQSMGYTMMYTTTYAIASKDFPTLMSTIIGLSKAGTGIGYNIGPFIGGFLYEYIGYPYPFLILGFITSLTALVAFWYIPSHSKDKNTQSCSEKSIENEKHLTWIEVIKIKDIWCMIYTLIIVGIVLSFHDSTLAVGCKQFNLSSSQIGIFFLSISWVYPLFAPIWGYIIDKYHHINDYLIVIGYILITSSFSFMGPIPFFDYKATIFLYTICLIVQKFACSMILVPSFKQCKDIVTKEHGFVESLQNSAIVSGLYASSYSLGCFFGPFIGSTLVEHVGYKESLSLIAALCFVSTILFTIIYLIPRFN